MALTLPEAGHDPHLAHLEQYMSAVTAFAARSQGGSPPTGRGGTRLRAGIGISEPAQKA